MNAITLLTLWKKLAGLPGGKSLFSFLVGWVVPYSGTVRPEILEIKPGYSKILMKDRKSIRNHLNSIHAVALMNFGELTSGLAFNAGLPENARGIVTHLSIDFFKKARGVLIAECQCKPPSTNAEQEMDVYVPISNAAGEEVARVAARWKIGPKKD